MNNISDTEYATQYATMPFRLLANITGMISPNLSQAAFESRSKSRSPGPQQRGRRKLPISLAFPKLDVSEAPILLRRQQNTRRRRDTPQLPEGEHSVAARSRIRSKTERRPSRTGQRRHDLNPTQSLRSSRRQSFPSDSLVVPIPSYALRANDIRKMKKKDKTRLPPHLPIKPASRPRPLFHDPWLEDRHRQATGITPGKSTYNLLDSLTSPKSLPKPTLLNPPPKLPPTTSTTQSRITATRKRKDISYVPASATKYLHNLQIDGKGLTIIHELHVRPQSYVPSPEPQLHKVPKKSRNLQSREYDVDMAGTRKCDRDSGFWDWRD